MDIVRTQQEEIARLDRHVEVPGPRPDFLVIYDSELEAIRREVLNYPDSEAGGMLFGHTTRTGVMTVDLMVRSGGNARHGRLDFRPDLAADARIADAVLKRNALEEIGSWHSHPPHLGPPRPSLGDVQMVGRLWDAIPRCVTSYIMVIARIADGDQVEIAPFLFNRHGAADPPRCLKILALDGVSPFAGLH